MCTEYYGKREHHARLIAGDRDFVGNENVDDEACSPTVGAAQSGSGGLAIPQTLVPIDIEDLVRVTARGHDRILPGP